MKHVHEIDLNKESISFPNFGSLKSVQSYNRHYMTEVLRL
jgi:hypothetical protein